MGVVRALFKSSPICTWTLSTPSQSASNFYVNINEFVSVQDRSDHVGCNVSYKIMQLVTDDAAIPAGTTATEVAIEIAYTGTPNTLVPGVDISCYTTGGAKVGIDVRLDFSTGGVWKSGRAVFTPTTELTEQQCKDIYFYLLTKGADGTYDPPEEIPED